MPVISFYTSRKHQKTRGYLIFSGVIKIDQWHKVGKNEKNVGYIKTFNEN